MAPRAPSVLVVDDEASIREVFARRLADAGCEVRTAGNALQALSILQDRPADVVVTDLLMPGLRGEILAEQVRVRFPGVRVVVVSGWIAPVSRRALAMGASAVLVLEKPLASLDDLVDAVCAPAAHGRTA